MKKLGLILILSAFNFISAQVEYSSGVNAYSSGPLFYIDVADYKSNKPDKTRLDVFIQVPYSQILFTKKDNIFNAGYSVTLTFYDIDKKNILFERMWKEKVTSNDFVQTLSRSSFNLSYRSFDFNPGSYLVKCTLEDADSKRSGSREFLITLDAITDSLAVSDPMLIAEILKDSTGEKVVPNISKIVTNKTKNLSFYFEAYSDKDRDVFFEYYLENLKAKKSTKQLSPQHLTAGVNTIYFTLDSTDFALGDYIIKIILKTNDWKEIVSSEKRFYSKIQGFPNSIVDLDKAVEQMMYIGSPDEIDFIEDSQTYDEKLNRFLSFWEKKKPNKQTDENPILYEYYRRIDYANKNFKGLGDGWRSDMGMIYVTFGPPNHVERHPLDPDSKPYEVWEYYDLNRSFVFLDQTGFGDYRLVNPDYSRWPGYRQ